VPAAQDATGDSAPPPQQTDAFSPDEVTGLPAPVVRYLTGAIVTGSPSVCSARLAMRGKIKVGRWLPFRAREILDPHRGFVWRARAGLVISGSDRYLDGEGSMRWRLLGLVDVARGAGPDVSRSAAGRAAAEAVWLPTALLPRFGVHWTATAPDRITAAYRLGATPLEIHYQLDEVGRIRSLVFDRWGDPTGTEDWGWHPFGGDFTGHGTFAGLTVPTTGRLGWFPGTDRWTEGEFFRFHITSLTPDAGVRLAP
jgi:hypothetical protein